jgi:hypothetical protein
MFFTFRPINRVIITTALSAVLFAGLAWVVPVSELTILLNGVFAGTMAAITVAYWRLLWNAVLGIRPYDRVRQMTLGFALCWAAYILGVAISIYFRSAGVDVNSSLLTAASRYVAIIAAMLQVTAPDFGLGLFHGRDRKVLATGITVGLIVAVIVVFGQNQEVLAEPGAGVITAPATAGQTNGSS